MINQQMLSQILMRSNNPFLLQLSKNQEAIRKAVNVAQGRTPKELEQYVKNAAHTQNADLSMIAQRMGLQLPH